jgi:S-(hydroxymethyl)glutathione dehydrogenase/alcohol dehydrogenase
VEAGEAVVVVGCGGVGLATVQGSRIANAEPVVAVDPLASKRKAALRFGATHAIDPAEDVPEAVRAATGGRLADHVFVTTASTSAMTSAIDLVAPMGTLVLVGMPDDGVTTRVDTGLLSARNQSILGSKMGTSRLAVDIPALVDHWRAGRLDLEGMVTSTHPLQEIGDAISQMRGGSAIRTVVCPGAQIEGSVV